MERDAAPEVLLNLPMPQVGTRQGLVTASRRSRPVRVWSPRKNGLGGGFGRGTLGRAPWAPRGLLP